MKAMTVKSGLTAMTVPEFGVRIGVKRTTAYELVAQGAVDLVNVAASGKRPALRITEEALAKFLAKRLIYRSAA